MKTKTQDQTSLSSGESTGPDSNGSSNATSGVGNNLAKQPELTPKEDHLTTGDNSSVLSSEATPMEIDSDNSVSSRKVLTSESRDHYHHVPSADNRNHQRPIFDGHCKELSSDKRRYLSDEIAHLKLELYNAVMQGISHDESTEEAKRFTAVSLKLEKAEKAFKMLFGQENTLVPNETPLFQWRGHIFNKNKPVYRTVEDCLDQFERVLFAHRLGLEENWRRLVPARLSTNMARWYAKCMTVGNFTSWTNFRIAVSNKYGRNQAGIKEEAREKLEHLLYDKANSFELFIENFQELKVQAEITDEDCLVRYLFKALPQELAQATKFYLNNNADKDEITADFAIKKVVATFEALFKQKWQDEGIMERKKGNFFDKKKTSINKRYREKVSSGASDKSKLICKYHPGLTGHSTENCLMNQDDKKKIDKIFKKFGKDVKFCYTCKAPNYKKGEHECSGVAKNKKRKTNDKIVPTNMDVDTTDAESETDGENDSHMTFSALAIEDKQDQ
ncbi:unnamed protein product [Mucor circinelloides]